MNSAIGPMNITSEGIVRLVTNRNTKNDCPLLVSRSTSRNACVTQTTLVRPPSVARNAVRAPLNM